MLSTSSIQSKWRGPKSSSRQGRNPSSRRRSNQVTKHVEVPLSQFSGKVVDIPVVARREVSQSQYLDQVVDVPAVLVVEQVPHVHVVAKKKISHSYRSLIR